MDVTGLSTFNGGAAIVGTATVDGNGIWHSGNDGAGSTLDADLLDGQEGSYYADISARLGYTPANLAGDIFTGECQFTKIRLNNTSASIKFYGPSDGSKWMTKNVGNNLNLLTDNADTNNLEGSTTSEGSKIFRSKLSLDETGDLEVSGSLVSARPHAFSAHKSGAAQTVIGRVAFDTETTDVRGDYDHTTNYRFTAPRDGTYLFVGGLIFDATAAGARGDWQFYKNGIAIGPVITAINDSGTSWQEAAGEVILDLVATDYVDIHVTVLTNMQIPAWTGNRFSGMIL